MAERLPQEGEQTPEERTTTFFNQDVMNLEKAMLGKFIVSQQDGKMIRVDKPEGWLRDNVGGRYTKSGKNLRLTELTPGTLGVFPLPVRKMRQILISARDGGNLGACVRLVRASQYDRVTNEFIQMPREGEIADFLGLDDNEAVKLKFVDESEMLYFIRGDDNGTRVETPVIPDIGSRTETANQYLRNLVN